MHGRTTQAPQALPRASIPVCVASVVAIAALTLWPAPEASAAERFSAMGFGANIALFVPAFAALATRRDGWGRLLFSAVLLSLGIEASQIAIPGRVPSAFDLAANVLGGVLGVGVVRFAQHARALGAPPGLVTLCGCALGAGGMLMLDTVGSTFVETHAPYYLQVTPRLSFLPHSSWEVAQYSFGGLSPRAGRLEPTVFRVARAPCGGGGMDATVRSSAPRSGDWAPVLRVSDDDGAELTELAEWQGRLFLATHSVAASLGAGLAWYEVGPPPGTPAAIQVRVSCAGNVLRWTWVRGTETGSGAWDLRVGHVIRSFSSSILAPLDARLLSLPVFVFWCALGVAAGAAWARFLAASHAASTRAVALVLTVVPAGLLLVVGQHDTHVVVLAWGLAFLVALMIRFPLAREMFRAHRPAH